MINVTVYVREPCQECDQALADLETLQSSVPHRLLKVNVDTDRGLRERIGDRLPVIEVGPYRLKPPFSRQDLHVILSAARDRLTRLEQDDPEAYQARVERGRTVTSADRITLWISRHYLAVANLLLFLYVGLPFLAPILLKANIPLPAQVIYRVYSPMCHQLAFRSWFLFGEQAYYPRQLAGAEGVMSYEALIGGGEIDLMEARGFLGNETVGYKTALCQRDIAIYGAILLFGLVMLVSGRRIPPIPWYVWIFFGLIPIALDGFSQLPSLAGNLPDWMPFRESTPALRTLTGAMFGWMTGWYLFPLLEQTARESRRVVTRKMAAAQQAPAARPPEA
jgi:uncharacterized membrane protein